MSSHYVLFCMSHDPPIIFGGASDFRDWNTPQPALDAIADRTSGPGQDHPNCEVIIGRYSGALVEVGIVYPHAVEWIDAEWLRLLAVATPGQLETARWPQHRTREHALRLQRQIGLDLPATQETNP